MNCESCGHENLEEARFCASCGTMLPAAGMEGHPWVGRLIGGRFRVTSVLGEGGMGVVYAGEQHMGSTVRKVAIKTLHPHLSQDPSVLARFHRECGTVAQLEHANTIKVYDFGAEEDGTLYIAMEFVDGRSLDKVIEEEGALDPERVVRILEQVCGALDEAHAQGIIHRDLKPENIVLTERLGNKDFVKVLDFGIAARSESADAAQEQKLTQQGMVLGTPPYMSPEQFTGQALDRRSDIYSLGIMTYQMLTGRLPFSAATAWQWATEHMTAQPFPLEQTPVGSNVPSPMRKAVMRALAKTASERQETAGEFFRELAADASSARGEADVQRVSTGTEAMPAAPVPSSGGQTEPLAAVPAAGLGPVMTPGAMAAPPPPRPQKSGGKGLVVGLGLVGVGLLVAMGVVLASGGGEEEPPMPMLADNAAKPASVAPETGEVKPDIPPADLPDETPTSEDSPSATPSSPPQTSTTKSPTTSTGGTSSATPTPTSTATPTPTSTATTPPPTPTATTPPAQTDCSACVASARSGNLQGAASALASCSPDTRASCRAELERQAVTRGTAAANAKRCDEAKGIAAVARGAGATRLGRLDSAIAKNCQ